MHYHIKAVKARPDFKLWVRFADGVEGEADLSDIAGKGVLAPDGLYRDIASPARAP